jgi:hydrogenase nickel incorporation protein HypB
MCATCGCEGHQHQHDHDHDHDHDHHEHDHPHEHGHEHRHGRRVPVEEEILAKNDRAAATNREWLAGRGIVALNLMSAPGAGKTTLLEETIRRLRGEMPIAVIEGDQETERDAERIRAAGCPALQINTGAGCHLDAEMVAGGLRALDPPPGSLVLIENVGNLVCPALFDLGERLRVVILSVAEGEDKPLKYPHMFRAADVMVLGKIDLLPHLAFDVDRCLGDAHRVNPRLRVLPVSGRRGDGLDDWCGWLRHELRLAAAAAGDGAVDRDRGPRAGHPAELPR